MKLYEVAVRLNVAEDRLNVEGSGATCGNRYDGV